MRRGYRRKVKRKIRPNAALMALGAIVLVAAVFFASFWITSLILRAGRDPIIPVQSDITIPSDDTLPQNVKPDTERADNNEEGKTATAIAPAEAEKPKETAPAQKPDLQPENSTKPADPAEKENAEQSTEKKPKPDVKPAEQPSVPPEKPVETPEPVEPQKPAPTPAKPSIEIISPNAG